MTSVEDVKLEELPADSDVVDDVVLESEVETNTSVTANSDHECLESSQSDADETTETTSQTTSDNRKSSWKTFCENFPNLNQGQWYSLDCFNSYWKNYEQVMSWYRKHLVVSNKLQRRFGSQQRLPASSSQPYVPPYQPYPVDPWYPDCSQYPGYSINQQQSLGQYYSYSNGPKKANKRGKQKRKQSRARKKKRDKAAKLDSILSDKDDVEDFESSSLTKVTETDESNMDFEITDEMLDFFAHSEKHKKEREAQKKLEEESMPEKMRVNIEEVKGQEMERSVAAPRERPGLRRAAEMKELYGQGAAMIHGMETALQMTYDRNTDIRRPKFWPNMPFRVQFA